MKESHPDIYQAAVAFLARYCARKGGVAEQPTHDPSLVWNKLRIVLLYNANWTLPFKFYRTEIGQPRFVALDPLDDHRKYVLLCERAEKAIAANSPKAPELLARLGFSDREIAAMTRTSHGALVGA